MYNCFTLHLIVLTVPKRNSANGLDVLNEICDVTYCNSVQRNFETETGLLDLVIYTCSIFVLG